VVQVANRPGLGDQDVRCSGIHGDQRREAEEGFAGSVVHRRKRRRVGGGDLAAFASDAGVAGDAGRYGAKKLYVLAPPIRPRRTPRRWRR